MRRFLHILVWSIAGAVAFPLLALGVDGDGLGFYVWGAVFGAGISFLPLAGRVGIAGGYLALIAAASIPELSGFDETFAALVTGIVAGVTTHAFQRLHAPRRTV